MSDWHTVSLVASSSLNIRWAIILPSFFIMLSFIGLLFIFSRRFIGWNYSPFHAPRYSEISFLGVFIFLTLSGIGGFTILRDRKWDWESTINHDSTQWTSSNDEIYWFHPVCHILLPQRSALFAYPLILVIVSTIYQLIHSHSSFSYPQRRKIYFLSGCITGLLPLIHAHSLMCLAFILIPYALLHFKRSFSLHNEHGLFLHWLYFGVPILIESLLQLPVYMDRLGSGSMSAASSNSFLNYKPLWRNSPWARFPNTSYYNEFLNFSLLWLRGTGIYVIFALIGFFFLNNRQRKLYFCFWIIFIAANFVQFQPWDKDNTKLFLIWSMICAPVVAFIISKIWNVHSFILKLVAVLLVISLVLSGTMMLYRESTLWWQFMVPQFFFPFLFCYELIN